MTIRTLLIHPVISRRSKTLQSGLLLIFLLTSLINNLKVYGTQIPRPDHVVVCILENHGLPQIYGSTDAPYLNQLANQGAILTSYYSQGYPSQPNYLMLFSGSDQGVTTDSLPTGTPWSAMNLGGSMLNAGFTFAAYSEDLPYIGSTVEVSGAYARKHCPWVNWQGNGLNQIDSTLSLPFTQFPTDYNTLPDLSFVIPNLDHNMHNGTDPSTIIIGDNWVQINLGPYINWAMTHNSLFILTFDEDDYFSGNKVFTIFNGPMVLNGVYSHPAHHHYDMLRTIEDMFNLPYAGNSATAPVISEVWNVSSVSSMNKPQYKSLVFPNPLSAQSKLMIEVNNIVAGDLMELNIYSVNGSFIRHEIILLNENITFCHLPMEGIKAGIYHYLGISTRTRRIAASGNFMITEADQE